jgi:hypothetical protein
MQGRDEKCRHNFSREIQRKETILWAEA